MNERCMTCGKPTPIHLLDAKPEQFRGRAMPDSSTDTTCDNLDFDWLECQSCYGPGWVEGVKA